MARTDAYMKKNKMWDQLKASRSGMREMEMEDKPERASSPMTITSPKKRKGKKKKHYGMRFNPK